MMMRWFNLSGNSITVAEALTREKNNFDLFRLIAALLGKRISNSFTTTANN
ncbi:MAG: hypothetical protein P8O79_13785 [Halieaceae bacterium]|nr:hypothetical protein [Halieaceae bacterium]